jgi:hypothetical protein
MYKVSNNFEGTDQTTVVVWRDTDTKVAHADSRCPATTHGGWVGRPARELNDLCPLCAWRKPALDWSDLQPGGSVSKIAAIVDCLVGGMVEAASGSPSAICYVSWVLAQASSSDDPSLQYASARSALARLRSSHRSECDIEIAARTIALESRTLGSRDLRIWQRVRWAVLHGVDLAVLQEHTGTPLEQALELREEVYVQANALCEGPRHMLLSALDGPVAGAMPQLLMYAGALGSLDGTVASTVLPRGVVSHLVEGWPGIWAADAGPIYPNENSEELCAITAALWRPGSSVLSHAPTVLEAARGLSS